MSQFPYLHGFDPVEQKRLREQAKIAEHSIYKNIDFSHCDNILEVGCGVGAQSEIMLRRFPHIQLTSIDKSTRQLEAAKANLKSQSYFDGRYEFQEMDASDLNLEKTFDGAFICFLLEHVPKPSTVLSEVRRNLKNGSKIYCTEVMNHSFFLDPYSPNMWKYWMAFNDYQYDQAGDPFIGAKLGNLLHSLGFKDVETNLINWHYDNRNPVQRHQAIIFWRDLLLSASDSLIEAKYTDEETVENVKKELDRVSKDPDAVFYYSFMQASATVG